MMDSVLAIAWVGVGSALGGMMLRRHDAGL